MKIVQINNFNDLIDAYESGQIDTNELFQCIEHAERPLVCFTPPNPITDEYKRNVISELRKYVQAIKRGFEAPLFITGEENYGINFYDN